MSIRRTSTCGTVSLLNKESRTVVWSSIWRVQYSSISISSKQVWWSLSSSSSPQEDSLAAALAAILFFGTQAFDHSREFLISVQRYVSSCIFLWCVSLVMLLMCCVSFWCHFTTIMISTNKQTTSMDCIARKECTIWT